MHWEAGTLFGLPLHSSFLLKEPSETVTVYVGNLSWTVTDEVLFDFLASRTRGVVSCKVSRNHSGQSKGFALATFADDASSASSRAPAEAALTVDCDGQSRGYGLVRFGSAEDAARAIDAFDGFEIDGRPMRCKFGGPAAVDATTRDRGRRRDGRRRGT
ncbi:RNA binding-protein [Aureococcus anophagefferens]|nr:RNA binding-protein [Aureococcus anophagefferens]